MMDMYRKKPIVIQAIQWTGDNTDEIMNLIPETVPVYDEETGAQSLIIHTLEGAIEAKVNDYIIKGIKGEFYPCKPDIFEATYEPA